MDPAALCVCEPLARRYDAAPALVDAAVAALVLPVVVAAPAVVPTPVVVLAAVLDVAGAVAPNCTPITCSSDCSIEPNRFCCVVAGTCAVVALPESSMESSCELFLWPRPWALTDGSAEVADVKFAIVDM